MVSIVIPVFNRKQYVEEMINSIIDQTYTDWELLLVDDGSTDGTCEMMCNKVIVDPRIKVYNRNREPKGAQTCRNIGLENAIGEYIMFLDSDDWIPNFCLQQRINVIKSKMNADFIVFPLLFFNYEINDRKDHIKGLNWYIDDLRYFINMYLPFLVCTNVYRTKSLKNNKITWDERLQSLQDSDFNIQSILSGLRYEYAVNVFVDYYVRLKGDTNSVSKSIVSSKRFDSHLYFLQKLYNTIPVHLLDKYKNAMRFCTKYICVLLINNYSEKHINQLFGLLKQDKCFYMNLKFIIWFYRNIWHNSIVIKVYLDLILFSEFLKVFQLNRKEKFFCKSNKTITI